MNIKIAVITPGQEDPVKYYRATDDHGELKNRFLGKYLKTLDDKVLILVDVMTDNLLPNFEPRWFDLAPVAHLDFVINPWLEIKYYVRPGGFSWTYEPYEPTVEEFNRFLRYQEKAEPMDDVPWGE